MKTLFLLILLSTGNLLYALGVECATVDNSSMAIYHADSMTMEFVSLRGTGPTVHGEMVKIVGEPQQKNHKAEYTANFEYRLENGQSVEILWNVGQAEILRDIPAQALVLKLFGANGELVGDYPNCRRR